MTKKSNYVFDTCFFIDFLRKPDESIIAWMKDIYSNRVNAYISVITEMELWIGASTPDQEKEVVSVLGNTNRIDVTSEIAIRTAVLLQPYRKNKAEKHSMIPDMIIAATAEHLEIDIATRNTKHFSGMQLNGVRIVNY